MKTKLADLRRRDVSYSAAKPGLIEIKIFQSIVLFITFQTSQNNLFLFVLGADAVVKGSQDGKSVSIPSAEACIDGKSCTIVRPVNSRLNHYNLNT